MTKKIIHVLGLGESLKFFKHDGNVTIGVNDINRHFETDYLLMVDPISETSKEYQTIIGNSNSKFYSQLDENESFVKNFNKIELARGRGVMDEFDSDRFVYSITSPFCAVHLAYKLGATDIVMWGVDFNTHRYTFHQDLEPMCKFKQERALKDFNNLKKALNDRNVNFYVGNEISIFSSILPVFQ